MEETVSKKAFRASVERQRHVTELRRAYNEALHQLNLAQNRLKALREALKVLGAEP